MIYIAFITMLENFVIPSGFHKVEADKVSEVLSLSGSRSAMYFFENDTIKCSDEVISKDQKVTRNGKEETIQVYYLVCQINNGAPKAVPFASFRRFPKDVDTFLSKSTLMRDLFSGSDSERFNLIKGKTLKVTSVEEGEAIDWTQSNLETRDFKFKKGKFPVLNYAQ